MAESPQLWTRSDLAGAADPTSSLSGTSLASVSSLEQEPLDAVGVLRLACLPLNAMAHVPFLAPPVGGEGGPGRLTHLLESLYVSRMSYLSVSWRATCEYRATS